MGLFRESCSDDSAANHRSLIHASRASEISKKDDSCFDADQFLFDKKSALEHFYAKVYEELLREQTFALYFYICFTKQLAREGSCSEHSLDILRRCLKKITQDDIEMLLYYEPDVANQIVKDLLNEPAVTYGHTSGGKQFLSSSKGDGGLDKETRNFALKIRK